MSNKLLTVTALSDKQYLRYSRQMLLADVSEKGQLALMNASVLIIGIGGLGQLVAQYLAAAGVGKLWLVDGDNVELSNLPRQILFDEQDLNRNKAKSAASKLESRYPDSRIFAIDKFVDSQNYQQVLLNKLADTPIDIVFDCSDNFTTRHLINHIAILQNITLISASIAADQGQFFCYQPPAKQFDKPMGCYHCLYPADMVINQNCTQVGVLGPAVGMMASMQALAGLNHLVGRQQEYGVLHRFDAKRFSWSKAVISVDKHCRVCG